MPPKEIAKPGVYYVNFPQFNISPIKQAPAPVGHAGTLIVNKDGTKTYYEYGQYDNNILGQTKSWDGKNILEMPGNWRYTDIKGSNLDDIAQELFKFQGDAAGNNVRFTHVDADPDIVLNKIKSDANNINRNEYSICRFGQNGIKNCGSQASSAISAGLSPKRDIINKTLGTAKRVATTGAPIKTALEILSGKGVSSDSILRLLTSSLLPHHIPTATVLDLVAGENTTNDFEDRYLLNKTKSFKRK